MKGTLLDEQTQHAIINRLVKLKADSQGLWGNMTVSDMLFHCRKINKNILQAKQQNRRPAFKEKIMKIIGLHLMKKFPRGVKTGSKYLPGPTDNIAFQKVQQELINSVIEVASYKDEIYGEHPFFGPLNTIEWRRFIWKHLDHHLRQFNV